MKTGGKSLIVTLFAVGTMLLLLSLGAPAPAPPPPASDPRSDTPAPAAEATPSVATPVKFYFDVTNHAPAEFRALLDRAHMIYADTPQEQRDELEIVLVLHGPDIRYFNPASAHEFQDIVDRAAQLDALDVFDFKVCTVAARGLGLDSDNLPAFLELVPYGPGEFEQLEQRGYVRL